MVEGLGVDTGAAVDAADRRSSAFPVVSDTNDNNNSPGLTSSPAAAASGPESPRNIGSSPNNARQSSSSLRISHSLPIASPTFNHGRKPSWGLQGGNKNTSNSPSADATADSSAIDPLSQVRFPFVLCEFRVRDSCELIFLPIYSISFDARIQENRSP